MTGMMNPGSSQHSRTAASQLGIVWNDARHMSKSSRMINSTIMSVSSDMDRRNAMARSSILHES